jgi:hypothetical protein
MKNLMYVGGDDYRELTPTDLDRLGVEDAEATLTFRKGRSLTVEDNIAEALLGRVSNLREATDEEMDAEMKNLEAELGFALYNPSEHTVAEVNETLASSSPERRQYILDQEAADQNRKTIFQSVGAEWKPKEETEEEMATHEEAVDAEVVDLDAQAADTAEAGGTPQTTTGTTGTTTRGRGTTASGGGTAGPANTSPSA